MLAGFAAAITSVIGAMAVFNHQTNRRIDDVKKDIAAVRDGADKNIDSLRQEMGAIRKELHDLVLHLISRPSARKQENAYETAPEQSVVREKPKK